MRDADDDDVVVDNNDDVVADNDNDDGVVVDNDNDNDVLVDTCDRRLCRPNLHGEGGVRARLLCGGGRGGKAASAGHDDRYCGDDDGRDETKLW